MTIKVMGIAGSPRKGGNTDLILDSFLSGARAAGSEVLKVNLVDYALKQCRGCGVCGTTHKCIIKDKMDGLINDLVSADVIVLATPVYFYTLSGTMKTFIDRTVPRYTELAGKDFYFIAAMWDNNSQHMDLTFNSLSGFTDCIPDAHVKGLIRGIGLWEKGAVKGSPVLLEAYQMGMKV